MNTIIVKVISAADKLLAKVTSKITCMQNKSRGRKELNRLDDRLLRDMGLTRWDIENELNKPCKFNG